MMENDDVKKLREIQIDLVKGSTTSQLDLAKRSVTSWPNAKDDVDEALKALSVLSKHVDNEALDLSPETVSTLTKAEDTLLAFFKKLGDDLEKYLVYQAEHVKIKIHDTKYKNLLIVVNDAEKEIFEKTRGMEGIDGIELVFDGFERLTGLPVFKFDPEHFLKNKKHDFTKKGK